MRCAVAPSPAPPTTYVHAGTTYLGAALDHARGVLSARDRTRARSAKTYLIVVSDGFTQDFVDESLDRLRAEVPDLQLYAVGLAKLNNE